MSEPMTEIVDLPTAERRAARRPPALRRRALIVCDNLVKIYKVADLEVVALQGLDLLVESGEFIALVGASGSRQEHAPQHPGRARRPVGRSCRGRRSRPRRDGLARADALPAPRHRLRLAADVAQPPAVPDRARERRAADGPRRACRPPTDKAVARELLEQVGLADRADHRPEPTVRRRAAARRDRGRPRQPTRGPARRRADRRARHRRPRTRSSTCSGGSTRSSASRSWSPPTTRWSASRSTGPWRSATVGSAARCSAIERSPRRATITSSATEYAVLDRAGPPPAAARTRRRARAASAGAPGARGRPHRGLAGSAGRVRTATKVDAGRRPVTSQYARPVRRHHGSPDRAPRSWSRRAASGATSRWARPSSTPWPTSTSASSAASSSPSGSLRVGQDDAPVADRRARPADDRPGVRRRRVDRRDGPGRAGRHPAPPDRLHLPGVRADVDPVRRRERRSAAPPGRAPSRASARSG